MTNGCKTPGFLSDIFLNIVRVFPVLANIFVNLFLFTRVFTSLMIFISSVFVIFCKSLYIKLQVEFFVFTSLCPTLYNKCLCFDTYHALWKGYHWKRHCKLVLLIFEKSMRLSFKERNFSCGLITILKALLLLYFLNGFP